MTAWLALAFFMAAFSVGSCDSLLSKSRSPRCCIVKAVWRLKWSERRSAHSPSSLGWQVAKKAGPATPKPAKRKAADGGDGGKAKRARAAEPRSASKPKKEVRHV